MPVGQTKGSLRLVVIALITFCVMVFAAIFFIIFHSSVPTILLRSETEYLTAQRDVVEGILLADRERSYHVVEDIAIWDEAAAFARGENPNFFRDNWRDDSSILQSFKFNYIVVESADGKSVHAEFYDYRNKKPLPVPDGFVDHLKSMAPAILKTAKSLKDGVKLGKLGIFFWNDMPYSMVALPILPISGAVEPAGVMYVGNILDNNYYQDTTSHKNITFALTKASSTDASGDGINRADSVTVSVMLPRRDMHGNPLHLFMTAPRHVYLAGKGLLDTTRLMLIASIILFGALIYFVVSRYMLSPVSRLSHDINAIAAGETGSARLDASRYSSSQEFETLCTSINGMLTSITQSQVSLDVLRSMLNSIDAFIYVTDPEDDTLLFLNDKAKEHYNVDDVAGKKCWQVFQKDFPGRCPFCPVPKLLDNPGTEIVWEELNSLTGKSYRNTDTLIRWTNGKLVHVQHSVDITSIRQTEAEVKKRLTQQELMAAMSQSFLGTADIATLAGNAFRMAGEFMDTDKILLARYDAQAGELLPEYEWIHDSLPFEPAVERRIPFRKGYAEYDGLILNKHPYLAVDDLQQEGDSFAYAKERGITALVNVPVYAFGNFWGILSFNEVESPRQWDESDIHLIRLIGTVISSVVERRITDEELLRMSSIVDYSPQYIAYVNAEGQFQYFNKSVETVTGYSAGELAAGGLKIIFDEATYDIALHEIIPAVLLRRSIVFELPIRCKNGEERIMSFSAFLTEGDTTGIGAIATDVTEQRRLEQDLIAAKDLAEQSNSAKSEFLSRMSHEMRTPMNAIIGMTSIGSSAADTEKKQYCLDKISDASTHLLGVINDILDMSKIEANKFELAPAEFQFDKMLLRVLNVVNFRIEEKRQKLVLNIAKNMPYAIEADEQRLAQVITNLFSNAVKFTPEEGTITLDARMESEEDGICTIYIAVTDTGIGIPAEHQSKLFHSFEQADGGISRKFGGTGLGLAISKRIVEMMDGTIWLESEEGKGSTFAFRIKAKRGESLGRALLGAGIDWDDVNILVVDDAEEVREHFLTIAEPLGLQCTTASSGEEACELIRKHPDRPYNIMFVDWKMPGMDGIELTRHIRRAVAANAVVIMISATEWAEIENDAKAAGVDMFIPKPLFSSLIVDCINDCIGKARGDMDMTREEYHANCFANSKILLAEDVEVNREIVITLLEDTGITIDCAENGREAVEKFAANPTDYAMIFMDIHMPEVDGYEATRRIRALDIAEAKSVPIIAMTANVFREDVERCLAAGMNGHIGKPINLDEMFAALREYCGMTPKDTA